jgi:hypothetical protein
MRGRVQHADRMQHTSVNPHLPINLPICNRPAASQPPVDQLLQLRSPMVGLLLGCFQLKLLTLGRA